MKTPMICLTILLISLSTIYAAEQPPPVLDTDGKELRAGVDYYLLSAIFGGGGGGLTLGSTGNETCPLDVVQEGSDLMNGLPAYFRPVNPKKGVIRLSTDLNIIFNASTICVQSTQWQLDFDDSIGRYYVGTGGMEGNPGPETISNWFKIQLGSVNKFVSAYKFVFCPTVCNTCRPVCGDVGIFFQNSTRRLVLTLNGERPFMVLFQRAYIESAASE